jgi:iron complex outermembrane receptor protein
MTRIWFSRVFALAGLIFFAPALVAQETPAAPADEAPEAAAPDDQNLYTEEIVVTARRREENLQQIPVSATAFTASNLEERSATRLHDLQGSTPNLDLTSGTFAGDTSDAVVFLRGVGQGDTAVFADPGVAIYLDGIYLARAQGSLLDLVNLERVEVLRGPQGTLFGKNTTGGAIQLITRRPQRELAARLALTAGSYDTLDGQLSVDGPLAENVFGSLALYSANSDGWSRSLSTGQKFHDDGRNFLRAGLEYAPEDGIQAYFTADYLKEKGAGGNQALVALVNTPFLAFYNQARIGAGFAPYSTAFLVDDPHDSYGAGTYIGRSFLEGEVFGVALDLSSQGDDLLWRSLTGYREIDYESANDPDGSPIPLSEGLFHERQHQISQELQLHGTGGKADWLVGAIYFDERPREDNTEYVLGGLFEALELAPGPIYSFPGVPGFLCNPGPPPPGVPCFGGAGNPLNFAFFLGQGRDFEIDIENESWALYGESTWRVGEKLSLTLGGRFTEDRKKIDYLSRNGFGMVDSDLHNAKTWSDWSGRLSLAWQARPELLLYGNLSRGFKSGGFNGRPQSRTVLDPFDPEIVVSVEVGAKADLLDRRLRLNAALFANDYNDIHFAASLQGAAGEPVFVTQNAGDAEIRGFELEAELHPAAYWVVSATAAWLDTELIEVDPRLPAGIDPGNRLPHAPESSFSFGLQKSAVIGKASLIARADWSYTSSYFNDIVNTETIGQDAYDLLAARLTYAPDAGRWEVSLYGTNLTDETYYASGFIAGAFGPSLVVAGKPREWGVQTTWRF